MNQLTILPPASDPLGSVRRERPRVERGRGRDERSFDDALAAAEQLDGERPDRVVSRETRRSHPPASSETRRRAREHAVDDRTVDGAPPAGDSPLVERSTAPEHEADDPHRPLAEATGPTPPTTAVATATTSATPLAPAPGGGQSDAVPTTTVPATPGLTTAAPTQAAVEPDAVTAAIQRAEISVLGEPATPAPSGAAGDPTTPAPAPATPADRAGAAGPAQVATPATTMAAVAATPEAGQLAGPRAPRPDRDGGGAGDAPAAGDAAASTSPTGGAAGGPAAARHRPEPATTDTGSFTDVVRGGSQPTTTTGADEPVADSSAPTAPSPSTAGDPSRPTPARLGGRHRLALDLGHEGLGPLRMEALTDGGTLHLNLLAGDRATTDALNARLPELRQDLENAGVRLGQLDVGTRQQDAPGHHGDLREPAPAAPSTTAGDHGRPAAGLPPRPRRVVTPDGFDLRL